jgi:hypothetical protein
VYPLDLDNLDMHLGMALKIWSAKLIEAAQANLMH